MPFDYSLVDKAVGRIVEKFNPTLIVVFGSVARGDARDDSDLDLLVVMDTPLPYRKRSGEVRVSLLGIMVPMDILVATPEEFERCKNDDRSFISEILGTGKVAYEA